MRKITSAVLLFERLALDALGSTVVPSTAGSRPVAEYSDTSYAYLSAPAPATAGPYSKLKAAGDCYPDERSSRA